MAAQGTANLMVVRLLRFWAWLSADQCIIRDVHEQEVPLHPNRAQTYLFCSWLLQALAERPIRTVVLKGRKTGVSTFEQAKNYFLCKTNNGQIASTLAHITDATSEIFRITHLMGNRDSESCPPILNRQMLQFPESGSRYSCHTAGGAGVGAGGTPNLLHMSEVALWIKNKRETHYTATSAVPSTPTSMILLESTARGTELFFNLYEKALDDEDPYEGLFFPWFFVEDGSTASPAVDDFEPTEEEIALYKLAKEYGITLTMDVLQWRRDRIRSIGEAMFKQEYPSTVEEAIEGEKGRVVPGIRECVVSKLPFHYEGIPQQDRVGGWDYGYNDPAAMVTAVVWDGCVWVFDVMRGSGMLADDMADPDRVHKGHTYYCDPSALGPRKELQDACRRKGIDARFVMAPRGRGAKDEIRDADTWDRLRRFIVQGKLKIHADVAGQFITEADNLFFNANTGKPEKKGSDACGHFDTLDALRYMICGITLESAGQGRPRIERPPTRREELRGFGHARDDRRDIVRR